jgi:hypothetical protein
VPAGGDALAARSYPSHAELVKRLQERCKRGGEQVPASVAFDVRIDRRGKVREATLVEPTGLSAWMTECVHRLMMQWPFRPGGGDVSGRFRAP